MERRLQLLLDLHRYSLVEAEASRSGRSVAAVIREAIDVRFDNADGQRAAAAQELLDTTQTTAGAEPDWAAVKAGLTADLDSTFADIP